MKAGTVKAVASDSIFLGGFGLSLAILGLAGWLLVSGRNNPPAPAKPKTSAAYTHLHCPSCFEEIPFDTDLKGTACQSCDEGPPLAPTVGSIHSYEIQKAKGRKIAFAIIAFVLLQGLILLAVIRYRALRRAADNERNRKFVVRCPFCQLKMRYLAAMAGRGHRCSRCKTAFELPPLSDEG